MSHKKTKTKTPKPLSPARIESRLARLTATRAKLVLQQDKLTMKIEQLRETAAEQTRALEQMATEEATLIAQLPQDKQIQYLMSNLHRDER